MTRDEFLAKKIGISFKKRWSKEKWFFIVWNWAKEQEWWNPFWISRMSSRVNCVAENLIHPDHFADAVAKYLGWDGIGE